MVDIWAGLRDWQAREIERTFVSELLKVMAIGLYPFEPGPVDISYCSDFNLRTLRIDVQFKYHPELNLDWDLASEDVYRYGSSVLFMTDNGRRIIEHYRYRETLPVPSNITLGEN